MSKKNNKVLVSGFSIGVLIFVYGLLLLIGGIQKAKGNTLVYDIFGRWYEGLFLLFASMSFVLAFAYKKNIFLVLAMFFAGLYTFLITSSRLGGKIAYANNFGLILVFVGIGGVISFVCQKPRQIYFLLYGLLVTLVGITFVVALTAQLYWIIPAGIAMAIGISIAAWAIVRRTKAEGREADNEKEDYQKNPEKKYIDYYKDKE